MLYTVFGLLDESGQLTVAAVIEGAIDPVDTDTNEDSQRWACSFSADSPEHAEKIAHEENRS